MADKIYRYAVKSGGKIFPAGVPVTTAAAKAAESIEIAAVKAAVEIAETVESGAEIDLDGMKKAELEELAEARGISLAGLKTKAEYIAAIKAQA